MEFKDAMKKTRAKKLENAAGIRHACKIATKYEETCSEKDNSARTRHACIIEAHGSTRTRIGTTQSRDHEDLIAGKGFNSLSHNNLVTQAFTQTPSNDNSGCEGRS